MKCEYCGKNVKQGEAYCPNCGAKTVAEVKTQEAPLPEPVSSVPKSTKKHMSAGKIILIVFLCSALLVFFIFGTLFLIFRAVTKNVNFNDIISDVEQWEAENDNYDESFDEWFSQYFDEDGDSNAFVPEREYKGRYDDYKGIESFIPGEIDDKTGAYSSEYANLDFQLPAAWNVYNEAELAKVYTDEGASKTLGNNKLYVYDFYADDTLTGNSMYIKFYNKDFFSEYKDLAAINKSIKDEVSVYAKAYKVKYDDDSYIMLNGEKYDQLACRISGDGVCCYQYDFTRDLGDYYMRINIFAYELDDVGEIIKILNSEG